MHSLPHDIFAADGFYSGQAFTFGMVIIGKSITMAMGVAPLYEE